MQSFFGRLKNTASYTSLVIFLHGRTSVKRKKTVFNNELNRVCSRHTWDRRSCLYSTPAGALTTPICTACVWCIGFARVQRPTKEHSDWNRNSPNSHFHPKLIRTS